MKNNSRFVVIEDVIILALRNYISKFLHSLHHVTVRKLIVFALMVNESATIIVWKKHLIDIHILIIQVWSTFMMN